VKSHQPSNPTTRRGTAERANRAQQLYLSEGFRVVASDQDADIMIRAAIGSG
jgi:hypothetical protein